MAHTFGSTARLPATATTTTANPATVAITCPAGTTVLWVGLVVSGTTQRTGGAPTYNGVSLTQAGAKVDAGGTPETYTEHWYLLRPPTGASYNVSVPNSNTLALTMSVATAAAASGYTSVLDTTSSASGSSTNPAASITASAAGNIVFAVCGNGATTWAPTARSGTQIHDWDAGSRGHAAQYVITGGSGSQATNWTFATSEDWGINNVSFKEQAISAPTVTTSSTTSIGQTTATGNGDVTADGGGNITERGVCWGTSSNPTTSGSHAAAASPGTGTFTADITGLTPAAHYYVRAYATNVAGTSYGSNSEFDALAYDKGWGPLPSIALVLDALAPLQGVVSNTSSATANSTPTGQTTVYVGVIANTACATANSTPAGASAGVGVISNSSSVTTSSTPAGTQTHVGAVSNTAVPTQNSNVSFNVGGMTPQWPAFMPSIGLLLSNISNTYCATLNANVAGNQQYTQGFPASTSIATQLSTPAGTLQYSGQRTLTWVSSIDPGVTGYFVYWDTVPRGNSDWTLYANSLDVGNVTVKTITGLQAGTTYYFNISSHGSGGHDSFESALVGEISAVAIDSGAIVSSTNIATQASTAAATQLQRGTVAAASIATQLSTPAGISANTGAVSNTTCAVSASTVSGVLTHVGVVSATSIATASSNPAATIAYAGQPQASASAVTAQSVSGVQVHTGVVSSSTVAISQTAVAGGQLGYGAVLPTASAVTVSTVSGQQPGVGAVSSTDTATQNSTVAGTQQHVGAVQSTAIATQTSSPAGATVNVATVANTASSTSASDVTGAQSHQAIVSATSSTTGTSNPAATYSIAGAVSSSVIATQLSQPTGVHAQQGTISNTACACSLSNVVGVIVNVAGVAGTQCATENEEPFGVQDHKAVISAPYVETINSNIIGIQTFLGQVAGTNLHITLAFPENVLDTLCYTQTTAVAGQQLSSVFTLAPRNSRCRTYNGRPRSLTRDAA